MLLFHVNKGEQLIVTPLPLDIFPLANSAYPTVEGDVMCWVENTTYPEYGEPDYTVPKSMLILFYFDIDWRPALSAEDFTPSVVDVYFPGWADGSTDKLNLEYGYTLKDEKYAEFKLYRWKRADSIDFFPLMKDGESLVTCSPNLAPAYWCGFMEGFMQGKEKQYAEMRDNGSCKDITYEEYLEQSY